MLYRLNTRMIMKGDDHRIKFAHRVVQLTTQSSQLSFLDSAHTQHGIPTILPFLLAAWADGQSHDTLVHTLL